MSNPTCSSDQGWLGDQTRLFIQSGIGNLLILVENYLEYFCGVRLPKNSATPTFYQIGAPEMTVIERRKKRFIHQDKLERICLFEPIILAFKQIRFCTILSIPLPGGHQEIFSVSVYTIHVLILTRKT